MPTTGGEHGGDPASSLWVAIADKTVALHDSGQFSGRSSTSGSAVFRAFGSANSGSPLIGEFADNATDLANKLWRKWNAYENVTLSLNNASTAMRCMRTRCGPCGAAQRATSRRSSFATRTQPTEAPTTPTTAIQMTGS